MPPKAKFTRGEIIETALEIVKTDGEEALTARSLGEKLGSSARPIFTVFSSMEEVQKEVVNAAMQIYNNLVEKGLHETPAFKGVGKAYITFATTYPKLFRLLFMKEFKEVPNLNTVLGFIDGNNEKILASVENSYGIDRENALKLYHHSWLYSHGIAVLIATKVCTFTEEQVSEMLTEVVSGMIKIIKTEGKL